MLKLGSLANSFQAKHQHTASVEGLKVLSFVNLSSLLELSAD